MAGPKGSKYFDIFLNYNFWLNTKSGQEILNEQLLQLLRDIEMTGSISAAALKNKISYRKAWGDIKNAEEILKFPIVEKKRGGKDGGVTILTVDGKHMLKAFEELTIEFDKSIHNIVKKFFHSLNENASEEKE
jgi:molybdate transport system regulatory protein